MGLFKQLLLCSSFLTSVSAFGSMPASLATLDEDPTILSPREDPFYTAPPNFESAAPGEILRMRPTRGNLTDLVTNSTESYNLLYRTTDSLYRPTWAVTTLFIPSNTASGANRLLSYQIAYDSSFIDASPSYALYAGPQDDITLALGQGWYVNVPDYEGPLAAFTAGVLSGHATLDSVRAALTFSKRMGLSDDARYAMWGYSGGALASEWAAELAVQYAPEMEFAGAALGGLTPNVTSVMAAVTGSIEAGLVPAGILGLTVQYPNIRQYLVDNLKTNGEFNKTGFLSAENMTLVEVIGTFANQNIEDYFVNGMDSLTSPQSQYVINRDGIMGYHGVPQMPVFAYKAIQDEVSPVEDTRTLVNRYCAVGANIWAQYNTVGSHTTESANGQTRAFQWLTAVLDNDYSRTGCTIEQVTVDASDSATSDFPMRMH